MPLTTQLTVPIHQNINDILSVVGQPEMVILDALRRYLLDICWQRIEQAEQKIATYEQRYGTIYDIFNQRVTTDEIFLGNLNKTYPMWEADAIEWLYRLEEARAWRKRSETILHESWPSLNQN